MRVTGAALGVRVFVAVLGYAALFAPLPAPHGPAAAIAAVGLITPLLAACWPGGPWASCVLFCAVTEWIVTVLLGTPRPLGVTLPLAAVLYLLHSTAALAASLPDRGQVEPLLLLRWAGRTALVLAASAPLMLLAAVTPPLTGSLFLGVLGLAATVALGVVLVALLHRDQPR